MSLAPGWTWASPLSQSPPPNHGEWPSRSRSTRRFHARVSGSPTPEYATAALMTPGRLPASAATRNAASGTSAGALRRQRGGSAAQRVARRAPTAPSGTASTSATSAIAGGRSGKSRVTLQVRTMITAAPIAAIAASATAGVHTHDSAGPSRPRASRRSPASSARAQAIASASAAASVSTPAAIATATTSAKFLRVWRPWTSRGNTTSSAPVAIGA